MTTEEAMTPDEMMTTDEIIAEFGGDADHPGVPREAIAAAEARREAIIPAFVVEIERFLAIRQPSAAELASSPLIVIVHLLGEWRASAAYRSVCRLLRRDSDIIDGLFGDSAPNLSAICAALFDGDREPIEAVILDPKADQYSRHACFEALVELAVKGKTDRSAVETFVRECYRRLEPRHDNFVWVGWIGAVAALALSDLAPLARKAITDEKVPYNFTDLKHYNADLEYAVAHPQSPWPRELAPREVPSTVDMLQEFADAASRNDAARSARANLLPPTTPGFGDDFADDKPAFNPWRDVGRNDPCPCGSGKKYKKCCLGKLDA